MESCQHNESQSLENTPVSKSTQSPQERIERIKKTKNIRKEKIQKKRIQNQSNLNQLGNDHEKDKVSREQRMEIQKEKNRIAAQLSRDRQKKYVQELETKIIELETQIEKQLCSRCRAPLSQDSSTQENHQKQAEMLPENQIEEKVQNFPLIEEEPFNFYRDESSASFNSIGKFFFVFMIAIALVSFSSSMDSTQVILENSGRILQAIAPIPAQPQQISSKMETSLVKLETLRSSIVEYKDANKFRNTENRCKYDYIQNYFLEEEELEAARRYQHTHFNNDRLVNCARPQLIMKKSPQEQENGSFFSGLLTIVLDNPQILEVSSHKGIMYLQNVISLRGLYQMQVKFMDIKKILGQNCLN